MAPILELVRDGGGVLTGRDHALRTLLSANLSETTGMSDVAQLHDTWNTRVRADVAAFPPLRVPDGFALKLDDHPHISPQRGLPAARELRRVARGVKPTTVEVTDAARAMRARSLAAVVAESTQRWAAYAPAQRAALELIVARIARWLRDAGEPAVV